MLASGIRTYNEPRDGKDLAGAGQAGDVWHVVEQGAHHH